MRERCTTLCRDLQALTGIGITPLEPEHPEAFYEAAAPQRFCRVCPFMQKNEFNTHLYGLGEAFRWGGHFIYYCPKGMIFIASAVLNESGDLDCGIIAGPVVMGELLDFKTYLEHPELRKEIEEVPRLSTARVRQLTEIIDTLSNSLHYESFEIKQNYNQQQFLNTIYDMRDKYMGEKEHYDYILTAESQLCALVTNHDKNGAQDLLNRLLGHIFFYHAGDLEDIKARTMELMVVISRAVIASGANVGDIFRYSKACVQGIDRCATVDDLSRWLSEIIQKFIAVSFDYINIKHSDVVFKTMDYIRRHCLEQVSLETVAWEVHLSKAYLSSIFKQETGCSLVEYTTKMRIEHSKKLLFETDLPLVEIANACSFGDQSYFSRVFKKYVGVSPKKYRDTRGTRTGA